MGLGNLNPGCACCAVLGPCDPCGVQVFYDDLIPWPDTWTEDATGDFYTDLGHPNYWIKARVPDDALQFAYQTFDVTGVTCITLRVTIEVKYTNPSGAPVEIHNCGLGKGGADPVAFGYLEFNVGTGMVPTEFTLKFEKTDATTWQVTKCQRALTQPTATLVSSLPRTMTMPDSFIARIFSGGPPDDPYVFETWYTDFYFYTD